MTSISRILCISTVLATQSTGAEEPQDWPLAASEIVRLDPASFKDLPAEILAYLNQRRCTIPQTPYFDHPHNVVEGHLDDSDILDVAVLCSIEQRSAILVFWDGVTSDVAQIADWADDDGWLQMGAEEMEFSRALSIANPDLITRYSVSYDSELNVDPRHDGVDDGYVGKASAVHYWDGQNWHRLQGAD